MQELICGKVEHAHQEWVAALDAVKDAIVVHDREFRILRCNLAYKRYVGLPFTEIIGRPYFELFPKTDAPLHNCLNELDQPFSEMKEEEVKVGDTLFRSRAYAIMDENGDYLYSVHTFEDITERKSAEEALKASELRFKAIFEGAHDGILIADAVTKKFTHANARICRMLGYTEEEMLSLGIGNIHPAKEFPYVLSQFEKQAKGEIELAADLPVIRKDGSVFFADVNSFPLVIEGKNHLAGFFRDITERKKAEATIRENEEKFRSITGSAQDAILMMDNDGKISYWNAAAEKIFGYSAKEVIGQLLHAFLAPERFLEAHYVGFKHFRKTGEGPAVGKTLELVALKKDGTEIPIELSLSAVMREGRWNAIGILRDISDRKLAEQKIHDEKIFSESVIQSMPDIFFLIDQNANLLQWNKKLEILNGLSSEEMKKANALTFVHEEDRKQVIEKLQEVLTTGVSSIETRLVLTNGVRNYLLTGNRFETQHGPNVIGVGIDITQRKQTELELESERDFNNHLVETAPLIIMILSKEGKIIRFNNYMERISGYLSDEVKGKDWFDLFLPEADREKMKALFLKAIDDISTQGNINPILKKDGTQMFVEWYDKTLKDAQGDTIGLLCMGVDVTERRKSEERLKLFRNLIDHSNDAIEVLDPLTLNFLDINETDCRLLGYTREEMLSMGAFDVDTGLSEESSQEIGKQIEKDGSANFETLHRRKDGSTYPVEVNVKLIELEKPYLLSTVRDITERKQSENALKRANRALKTLSAGNLALVRAKSEDELLKEITRVIVENGNYSLAVVDFADNNMKKSITPVSWAGFENRNYWMKNLSWADTQEEVLPVARAIRTGKTQICHDIANDSSFRSWKEGALAHGYLSNIALPLLENESAFGALCIYSSEIESFDEDEVKLLEELANDLAYGIINLRRRIEHEQHSLLMQQSLEQSIQAIAATLESRDPYTAGHQRRVAELATAIAQEMNLPEKQIQGIRFAAVIHDLGKIHIPAEILSKPGKLNEIEYKFIQMHPQSGYDILKNIKFPWPIADIILQHHEKLDGSGYPQGLTGDKILLESKIVCVADVVEAISSHRPYRPSLGIQAALDEIRRGRGSVYDETVVDACLRLFKEKGFIFDIESF